MFIKLRTIQVNIIYVEITYNLSNNIDQCKLLTFPYISPPDHYLIRYRFLN